ncbi:MAG: acetate--CoA ligase family protein [Candidatus Nealsonbacteria bacterium]
MGLLNFQETKKLLLKYKIPVCQTRLTKSKKEALIFAKKIGYPAVLKISSPDILHKSDIDGVKTGVKNEKELKKVWDEILNRIKKKKPQAKVDGILVQKMEEGIEVAAGMKKDLQFGPVLMVGLGGVFIEVLKDVSFRVAPVNEKEGLEMLKTLKSFPILTGARKRKPVNIKSISKIIASLSKLSLKEKNIKEIDLNPIIVNQKGALVVDVKILI